MKRSLVILVILTSFSFSRMWAQDVYEEKATSVSNIGMTVTNLGLIGNAFSGSYQIEGMPSGEYPVGSGIEHLFDGGLWIGGLINGSVTAVSTGAVDASGGYATGNAGFEFTSSTGLTERSSLFDSPFYSTQAISHQDYVADFTEKNTVINGTIPIIDHDNPMGLDIHFEAYNWNFNFANFFVILNFTIKNNGTNFIDSLYLGYWADMVVRNVNITPPFSSGFFSHGGNGYLDSLQIAYEFDADGDVPYTNSYIGIKFLGAEDISGFKHPDVNPAFNHFYNTWQFRNSTDPLYFFPQTDGQRYGKMTTGLNVRADWETAIRPNIKTPSNRTSLVSVGPFTTLAPGQEVNIAFAVICARKNDDGNPTTADTWAQKLNLMQNASWAQTAFNGEDVNFNGILDTGEDRDGNGQITRYILPSPPDIPKMKIVPLDNKIEVYWTAGSESSVDPISKQQDFEGYRLYKTKVGFDVSDVQDIQKELKLIAQWDKAGNGLFFDTGLDEIRLAQPATFEGDTNKYVYKYTFEAIQNGWQHVIALTSFDTGDEVNNLESLESSTLANMRRVYAGKPGNQGFENGDPFVYPNPYYSGASWEGSSSFEEDRKIMFANLPAKCQIRIYTLAGDLVDIIDHDENYDGSDIRWFETYSDPENTQFSGGEHGWDLLSKDNQIIARGLYLFAVKDLESGKVFQGKFVVIK